MIDVRQRIKIFKEYIDQMENMVTAQQNEKETHFTHRSRRYLKMKMNDTF